MERTGDSNPEVGAIQQALVEAGFSLDPIETAAQKFGLSTYNAVRQFQATHVGSDGHALSEDGVVGPETSWALQHGSQSWARGTRFTAPGWSCSPSKARPEVVGVIRWAVGLIGMQEQPTGSNRGPKIDEWAQAAGIDLGSPWCALFCSAAYQQLSIGSPFGWLASAYKLEEWARQNKRLLAADDPLLPGDIWGILRADFHGHVGLVADLTADGKVCSAEGNSSDSVRGLVRDRSTLSFVLRPIPL